jgi:broad specificity phosphatase PhoE
VAPQGLAALADAPAQSDADSRSAAPLRIVLIRHGRPAIALSPRTGHHGFRDYIGAYEEAGLDSQNLPPQALQDLVKELSVLHTSGKRRAHESAARLAPHAELIADPLFVEAPLASPRIPLLKMTVPKWAVVSRLLWHVGFSPRVENYRRVKQRVRAAADVLIHSAQTSRGTAAVVAHGYFNFLLGRELRRQGFHRTGAHRAEYWNAVVYEKN